MDSSNSWVGVVVSAIASGVAIFVSVRGNYQSKRALEVSLDQTDYEFDISSDDEGKSLTLFNQSPQMVKDVKISVTYDGCVVLDESADFLDRFGEYRFDSPDIAHQVGIKKRNPPTNVAAYQYFERGCLSVTVSIVWSTEVGIRRNMKLIDKQVGNWEPPIR